MRHPQDIPLAENPIRCLSVKNTRTYTLRCLRPSIVVISCRTFTQTIRFSRSLNIIVHQTYFTLLSSNSSGTMQSFLYSKEANNVDYSSQQTLHAADSLLICTVRHLDKFYKYHQFIVEGPQSAQQSIIDSSRFQFPKLRVQSERRPRTDNFLAHGYRF